MVGFKAIVVTVAGPNTPHKSRFRSSTCSRKDVHSTCYLVPIRCFPFLPQNRQRPHRERGPSRESQLPMLPRPEITDALGITYRRIPILAIGNDVYCDTSLITSVLERRFPTSKGYRSLFPARKNGGSADTGLVKAISNFYADRVLFAPASSLLPWDKIPESFLKDRSALRGSPLDRKAIAAARPLSETFLSSNILLIEEQLSDSRDWLFDTESPSLADISIHFVFAWARSFRGTESLFDSSKNPHTVKWLDRMNDFLKKQRASQKVPTKLHGADAASRIVSGSHESYDIVGFEALEASRLGVKLGDIVQIAPEDTGRDYPTVGKLVALNREELVLEVQGGKGLIRCHFPRLGFFVKQASASPKL